MTLAVPAPAERNYLQLEHIELFFFVDNLRERESIIGKKEEY